VLDDLKCSPTGKRERKGGRKGEGEKDRSSDFTEGQCAQKVDGAQPSENHRNGGRKGGGIDRGRRVVRAIRRGVLIEWAKFVSVGGGGGGEEEKKSPGTRLCSSETLVNGQANGELDSSQSAIREGEGRKEAPYRWLGRKIFGWSGGRRARKGLYLHDMEDVKRGGGRPQHQGFNGGGGGNRKDKEHS